jgi:hypothetical protein
MEDEGWPKRECHTSTEVLTPRRALSSRVLGTTILDVLIGYSPPSLFPSRRVRPVSLSLIKK